MSLPNPQQPGRADEALEILRRLEPVLNGLQAHMK